MWSVVGTVAVLNSNETKEKIQNLLKSIGDWSILYLLFVLGAFRIHVWVLILHCNNLYIFFLEKYMCQSRSVPYVRKIEFLFPNELSYRLELSKFVYLSMFVKLPLLRACVFLFQCIVLVYMCTFIIAYVFGVTCCNLNLYCTKWFIE